MTLIPILLVTICLWPGCKKQTPVQPASDDPVDSLAIPGWELVWHDEFEGTVVDDNKWECEVNGDGGGNNELQYYTARDKNSFVQNGALTLQALQESYQGKAYTSARMRTKNKGDWRYGRFDVRAKLPYGKGLWPAIWMLPTDWEYGGWPTSGEIDIMESLGHEPWKVYGTIHWGASAAQHQSSGGNLSLASGTFAGDLHTFTLEWDSTTIKWLIDGKQYFQTTKSAPFDKRFHLLLNVAVGGNWPGSPNEFTTFPQMMTVDYVRVYKRSGP